MGNKKTAIKAADEAARGSAEALSEVLARDRQALAKLYNTRNGRSADIDKAKNNLLHHENELLKKELSELEKLMNEKL